MAPPNNYGRDPRVPAMRDGRVDVPEVADRGTELRKPNENERMPEIARCLDAQKNLIDELWSRVMKTEERLGPLLGIEPPKASADGAAGRIESMTHIGGVLDENNRSLANMIEKLGLLHKRLEI